MTVQIVKEHSNGSPFILSEISFLKMKKHKGFVRITDTKGNTHVWYNKDYDYITVRK